MLEAGFGLPRIDQHPLKDRRYPHLRASRSGPGVFASARERERFHRHTGSSCRVWRTPTGGHSLLALWAPVVVRDTCPTITRGRWSAAGFIGDILYSIGVTGFITRHRSTGRGARRLAGGHGRRSGAAGSTVVHDGGAIADRRDRPRAAACRVFARDGGGPPAHTTSFSARLVANPLVWLAGFNPGSTLSALDIRASDATFNTTMAACSAGLAALFYAYARSGKWDLGLTVNGFLAGLVAITCPCYWVSPTGAFLLGAVAGVLVIWATDALEYLRIDDPIGAVPVHMVCGIWGTLSLGLFATGAYGLPTPTGVDLTVSVKGLFYGGGTAQLMSQLIGSGAVTFATLAVSVVLMYSVKATGTLRVSREGELEGLDLHEHGMVAYPEYVIHGYEPGPTSMPGAHTQASMAVPNPNPLKAR